MTTSDFLTEDPPTEVVDCEFRSPLYLCRCLQITEEKLCDIIETHDLQTLNEVRRMTGAGNGCNGCHYRIKQLLETVSTDADFARAKQCGLSRG